MPDSHNIIRISVCIRRGTPVLTIATVAQIFWSRALSRAQHCRIRTRFLMSSRVLH